MNDLTIDGIAAVIREHKGEIIQKYTIKEIGIFGSFARGEQKKKSDVDILVEFEENELPSLLEFVGFESYLGKLIKRKVDLVEKSGIRPELKPAILKDVVYL